MIHIEDRDRDDDFSRFGRYSLTVACTGTDTDLRGTRQIVGKVYEIGGRCSHCFRGTKDTSSSRNSVFGEQNKVPDANRFA